MKACYSFEGVSLDKQNLVSRELNELGVNVEVKHKPGSDKLSGQIILSGMEHAIELAISFINAQPEYLSRFNPEH